MLLAFRHEFYRHVQASLDTASDAADDAIMNDSSENKWAGARLTSEVSSEAFERAWKARDLRAAYVRAVNGTERDAKFLAHFSASKDRGLFTGLYLHFRQVRRPEFQLQVFGDAANVLGYGSGDLWPALAFEDNESLDGSLSEEIYNVGGKIVADGLRATYGGCVIKISQSVWDRMLRPAWVFQFPLWIEEQEDVLGLNGREYLLGGRAGASGGEPSLFSWERAIALPRVPFPPKNLTHEALEDLARGLELIAQGVRKLGASRDVGHGHAHEHGDGHGHGHG